jgi:hypothetical protein
MTPFNRLRHDEKGMSFVFVGVGFMAFLAATTLAIDVGMFMTARTQAQSSADAGALAGAISLVFDSYHDRSPSGPAVSSALAGARANEVMAQEVSVTPSDVTFPTDENGVANRVRVHVYRTRERENPVPTLMGTMFGVRSADILAVATAEASGANAATCVKPWAVPDKWDERTNPPWTEDSKFEVYDNQGTLLANPDVYIPATNPGYTGYTPDPAGPDYGRRIMLKAGNPHQATSPSHYFPIAMPPNTGASWYESNIHGCWPGIMQIGDEIPLEPGNMTGPTVSGTSMLIDLDPNAYWDPVARKVVSQHNPSPRVIVIPVFDPMVYEDSRQHGRQTIRVANLFSFFVENMTGNTVYGRIVPTTGLMRGSAGSPEGAFLKVIRLVQ